MKDKRTKREEAEKRQKTYNNLSKKEKISRLDKKLGRGVGAKKEREKLNNSDTEGDKDETKS